MAELKPIGEILPVSRTMKGRSGPTPDDAPLTERDQLVLELVQVGISLRKAENLVGKHSEALIRKQLDWLPLRAARRPASLLIASIERDFEAPAYADEK
jgi:hypothetical protein